MRIDDLKLRYKLLPPVAVTIVAVALSTTFAAIKFREMTERAHDIIAHRSLAATQLARATRNLVLAEREAYVLVANDSESALGKGAVRDFEPALSNSISLTEQAAALLPERSQQILGFRDRMKEIFPPIREAFRIGVAIPGLINVERFKRDDLLELEKAVEVLGQAGLKSDELLATVLAFNNSLIQENSVLSDDLTSDALRATIYLILIGAFAGITAAACTLWLSSKRVAAPITRITDSMLRLARGDIRTEIFGRGRADEIGSMADAVQVFKDNAVQKLRLEGEAKAAQQASEAERVRIEAMKEEEARQQTSVVEAIGQGLLSLAEGNLVYRIGQTFPCAYERLRTDFNDAMERLQGTVSVVASNTFAIKSGTKEISTSADDLARRTEQQAANLEETSAALQQLTEMVRQTSSGATHAHRLVEKAEAQATQSGQIVKEAIDAMGNIDKSSSKMSQIIGVIDEIAFQTNLLALNAGVEAARAGDAGKGFAVVASEVRALAQRSAEAAKEIKGLISASTAEVGKGVDLVGRTGEALVQIEKSISEITTIVSDISQRAQEQASGIAEINTAIGQMDKNTQQNAAMVEESTAASHNLAHETDGLAKLIEGFEIGLRPSEQRKTAMSSAGVVRNTAPPAHEQRRVVGEAPLALGNVDSWEDF